MPLWTQSPDVPPNASVGATSATVRSSAARTSLPGRRGLTWRRTRRTSGAGPGGAGDRCVQRRAGAPDRLACEEATDRPFDAEQVAADDRVPAIRDGDHWVRGMSAPSASVSSMGCARPACPPRPGPGRREAGRPPAAPAGRARLSWRGPSLRPPPPRTARPATRPAPARPRGRARRAAPAGTPSRSRACGCPRRRREEARSDRSAATARPRRVLAAGRGRARDAASVNGGRGDPGTSQPRVETPELVRERDSAARAARAGLRGGSAPRRPSCRG